MVSSGLGVGATHDSRFWHCESGECRQDDKCSGFAAHQCAGPVEVRINDMDAEGFRQASAEISDYALMW